MQLTNPISATENCRYCLMCRHVCPVGHVTKLETLTPHGWALTIASVRRDLLTWNDETVGALYHCADCGTCRAHCVTDQPLPDAIASARAEVAARGLAPDTIYTLAETLKRWGNPYGQQMPAASEGQAEVELGLDALGGKGQGEMTEEHGASKSERHQDSDQAGRVLQAPKMTKAPPRRRQGLGRPVCGEGGSRSPVKRGPEIRASRAAVPGAGRSPAP